MKIEFYSKTILPQISPIGELGLRLFRAAVSGFFISCLVIRFLVKDRIDALSVVYYCTPLPVLAIFSLLLGMIWLLSKRLRIAQACFLFTLACLAIWSYKNISLNSHAQSAGEMKLFFWNTASSRRAKEITRYVQNFNADIIGFVEAGIGKKKVVTWQHAFPNYEVQVLPGNMALLTRGKILSTESGSLNKRGRFNLLNVALDGKLFYVLLVDIDGDPLRSRAPAFEQLAEMIRSYAHGNLIVMGDFNTPLDSVLFEPFRQYLVHAFESAGMGFSPSWPVPLPVLVIDHIWVSKSLTVVNCNLNWSRYSDHRSVVAHIEPPPSAAGETCLR